MSDGKSPAEQAFLTISTSPNSTEAAAELLHAFAASFSRGGAPLRLAARVVAGEAREGGGGRIISEHSADALREMAFSALDALSADHGDNTARHAAHYLQGSRSAGRRPIDDTAPLAAVARLEQQGRGRAAVGIVARQMAATPCDVPTIERRLREKRSKNKTE